MPDDVIFVEPNPFGSRLQVLRALARGVIDRGSNAFVVFPARPAGADLDDFESGLPRGRLTVATTASYRSSARGWVPLGNLLTSLMTVRKLVRRGRRTIVLTAIDDYVRWLWVMIPLTRLSAPRSKIIVVRYRVEDLLPQASLRQTLVKRLYYSSLMRVGRCRLIQFDERVPTSSEVSWIPDPWTGPFAPGPRPAARAPRIGLVGFQDERKGFLTAVGSLVRLATRLDGLHVSITGRVDPRYHSLVGNLQQAFGDRLDHEQTFVSDEVLAERLRACDLILLPYSRQFTSTSGVLIRAAASGTPVVSSETGLVGFRVREYGLGWTAPSTDVEAFAAAVEVALDEMKNQSEAQVLAHNLQRFAQDFSEDRCAILFGDLV